jgi:hypothetical protein
MRCMGDQINRSGQTVGAHTAIKGTLSTNKQPVTQITQKLNLQRRLFRGVMHEKRGSGGCGADWDRSSPVVIGMQAFI